MNIETKYLEKLLNRLAEKTGQSLDHYGFGLMSEGIEEVSQRYLYEKVFKRMEKAKKDQEETINLNINKLDKISHFLGFKNFGDFKNIADSSNLSEVLKGCIGNWYSYVRRSTKKGAIYMSPVRVYRDGLKVFLQLKGPEWAYVGELRLKSGCLFCLFIAEGGKEFHHVYKIGNMLNPYVLQGVFSGVLSANEPIGGRAVLIKQEAPFESLNNQEVNIEDMKNSPKLVDRRLAQYFDSYEDNNLRILPVYTFDKDDLGDCD